jgi:SAM-dependent methyltransferase
LEAFEELGCSMKSAKAGDVLQQIPFAPQHGRLVEYLYEVLEADGRLINLDGGVITRTAVSVPAKSSKEIVDSLIAAYPNHNFANRLTYYCGGFLVEVLKGKVDGVKIIFGNEEGRSLVSGLYGDSLLNKLFYTQMQDIVRRVFSRLPQGSGPFKILEMGAGTGGTTQYLVPLLAELTQEFDVPVEYTFTDLSGAFVAQARKKYKQYPFMKFASHDIEKAPSDPAHFGTQHLIVASNAVHATHSLPISLGNMRKFLRPDGFVMMLEMTDQVRWVDMIFGLLEGWWLFDDGRRHALSHQSRWEKEMHAVGFGHVDWTDGNHPENCIQRIIIGMVSGSQ